jgi:hypothetical protein
MMKKLTLLAVLLSGAWWVHAQQVAGQFGNATVASTPTISCTTPLAFGPQVINTTGPALASVCSNPGNALVTISTIVETGSGFAVAAGQNGCLAGSNIAPGTTCFVFVNFSPVAVTGYTGTVVVTVPGAIGSPQTINLTGNGVNSSGGGPGNFTAPTNQVDTSCGTPPCTYSYGANYPASFTENTIVVDASVVHTSAGGWSGSNKGAFFLCAGPNMVTALHAANSSIPLTASTRTLSGSSANGWSADKSMISLSASIGAQTFITNVNLTPGVGFGCTLKELVPATFSAGGDPPLFSMTQAKLLYGSLNGGPNFSTLDESTSPGTTTQVYTFAGTVPGGSAGPCPGLGAGVGAGSWIGSLDVTANGYDTRIAGVIGNATGGQGGGPEGQNTWSYAVVLDHRPSTGWTCRWYNVKLDTMGGDTNFAGGAPGSCTNCLGQAAAGGTGIHAVEISMDGNYLEIAEQNTIGIVIWKIDSTTITNPNQQLVNQGHRTWGLNILTWFTSGNNAAIDYLNGATPNNVIRLSNRFPQGQIAQHVSWLGVNSNQNNGVYQSTYALSVSPGGCIDNTLPGVGEAMLNLMDGTGKAFRFLRTRTNSCSGIDANFFYASPRGNVTRDQTAFTFSSNQNGLFGLDNGGAQAHSKVYVFIGELR